jgi:hypothetical protein
LAMNSTKSVYIALPSLGASFPSRYELPEFIWKRVTSQERGSRC